MDEHFCTTWKWCELHSHVDGFGGMQFCRIYQEWQQEGRPWPVADYIIRAANDIPPHVRFSLNTDGTIQVHQPAPQ